MQLKQKIIKLYDGNSSDLRLAAQALRKGEASVNRRISNKALRFPLLTKQITYMMPQLQKQTKDLVQKLQTTLFSPKRQTIFSPKRSPRPIKIKIRLKAPEQPELKLKEQDLKNEHQKAQQRQFNMQKKLDSLRAKSLQRKKYLKSLSSQFKRKDTSSPLYKKIEAKFKEKEIKLEQERKRESPLQKHSKTIDYIRKPIIINNQTVKISKLTQLVIDRDQIERSLKANKLRQKAELVKKRENYAKQVKLLKLPRIKKAMLVVKSKENTQTTSSRSISCVKPRKKFKSFKQTIAPSAISIESRARDYLSQFKEFRDAKDWDALGFKAQTHNLRSYTNIRKLQDSVIRKFLVLQRACGKSPLNSGLVDAEEQINTLFLSSLNAKVSLLKDQKIVETYLSDNLKSFDY